MSVQSVLLSIMSSLKAILLTIATLKPLMVNIPLFSKMAP